MQQQAWTAAYLCAPEVAQQHLTKGSLPKLSPDVNLSAMYMTPMQLSMTQGSVCWQVRKQDFKDTATMTVRTHYLAQLHPPSPDAPPQRSPAPTGQQQLGTCPQWTDLGPAEGREDRATRLTVAFGCSDMCFDVCTG
jgi:hypothetical protein